MVSAGQSSCFPTILLPVSYTHLDVYKRQDTFSLGNVLLYGEFPGKGKENSLTGEMAELFISKIFGDVYKRQALPLCEILFHVQRECEVLHESNGWSEQPYLWSLQARMDEEIRNGSQTTSSRTEWSSLNSQLGRKSREQPLSAFFLIGTEKMKQIQFTQAYNNEAAHRQVKLLMKQHKHCLLYTSRCV